MTYRHLQRGYFALPTLALFIGIIVFVTVVAGTDALGAMIALAVFLVVMLGVLINFSQLEVTVDHQQVTAKFGLGRPRKTIELDNVIAARVVRNRWIHGWGIRKIKNGWMYNVWGMDAVELELASGKVFRIGTDDPSGLVSALG